MPQPVVRYQKNFGLLIAFLAMVTVLYVVAVGLARSTIANHVESEFYNRKTDVFDATIKQFNDFLYNGIPELSYYQGFLDSTQARQFAEQTLRKNPFVEEVVFYDVTITNSKMMSRGVRYRDNLLFHSKAIISFGLDSDYRLRSNSNFQEKPDPYGGDFNNAAIKFFDYIAKVNESTTLTEDEIYRVFYSFSPGKIGYLNIPRISDLLLYKALLLNDSLPDAFFEQDMFLFRINPQKLRLRNTQPRYYEKISITPLTDPAAMEEKTFYTTELPLPGALSDFKIKFDSSQEFISKEIYRWLIPVVLGISFLYVVLLSIIYLIYRNINNNNRLYRLQYDFINNLTHEFKTPVSVIKIAGNNIKSAQKVSDEERFMYGRILDQEADKLNNLMNKLLSYAQIENKSIPYKGDWINLHDFCDEIFKACRIKYNDISLTYHINVKDELYTDPVLLASVFHNLVDNAYKYSEAGSRSIHVEVEQTKKSFVIVFSDKGIGIAKGELKNIFKKFYRIKNQYNQGGSIGLGLAFCKEITEFMGGEIRVESVLGEGTIFTLTFPK
ncbi:HAMP domain-containing histidine kinase [Sphingobacterium sp. lm-10]|uniref:sensor histidine kinase n=1 Tax=Sphingobacterium sp. lm-10 TaxID=2944904 RepID=UPI0020208D7E|nr:HAMP domain-containing histidine kinase [Sphingobacterium sp. lm-10]